MTRTRLTIDLDFGPFPSAVALHPRIQQPDRKALELPSIILGDHPGPSDVLYMMMVLSAQAMHASGLEVAGPDLSAVVDRIKTFNSSDAVAAALSKQGQN